MNKTKQTDSLIVPAYINEKIVLDMLAILEDGFSTVSQVNYSEKTDLADANKLSASASSGFFINKLLKIDVSGHMNQSSGNSQESNVLKEKVHTNVSLFSKFRDYLLNNNILRKDISFSDISIGDFIEIQGTIEKNPLLNLFDIIINAFRLSDALSSQADLGNKTKSKQQKLEDKALLDQIKALSDELKINGTVDYTMNNGAYTAVLSVQEQYLANENTSELIGGQFKVLGKVIAICNEQENINLLRKTTLSILPEEILQDAFSGLEKEELKQYNLPILSTRISGPAIVIIPVAIYA